MPREKETDQAFSIKLTGKPGDKKLEISGIPTIQIGSQAVETKDGDIRFTGNLIVDGDVYTEGSEKPIEPGTYVEANPEGEASADLTKVKIADTTYDLAGGTTVVANPTDSSSVDLTKLQVGNSIYNIPHATETLSRIYTVESISSVPTDILEAVNTGDVVSVVGGGLSTTEYRCTRKSVSKAIFEYIEGRDETAGGPGLYLYSVTYKKTSGTWSCSTFGRDVKAVEGNTVETPTTDLTNLKIGGTVYGVPSGGGGTTVVANPTLTGTEADLTGLQVGETKYKVSSELKAISLFDSANIDYSVGQFGGSKVTVNQNSLENLLKAIVSKVVGHMFVARTEAGTYESQDDVRSATSIIPAIIYIPLKQMVMFPKSSASEEGNKIISATSLLCFLLGKGGTGMDATAILEGNCNVLGCLDYDIRSDVTLVSPGEVEATYYNMGAPYIRSGPSGIDEFPLYQSSMSGVVNFIDQLGDIAFLDEIDYIGFDSEGSVYTKGSVKMDSNIKYLISTTFGIVMCAQGLGGGT